MKAMGMAGGGGFLLECVKREYQLISLFFWGGGMLRFE